MAGLVDALSGALRRARIALKRRSYSGWRRDRWQQPDRVMAELGLRPGDTVAEIGAGGGYFTPWLARAVGPSGVVHAVDTDPDMLAGLTAMAREPGLASVLVVRARPGDPGLEEPVDLVFLANAYHHLPERPAYLAGLARHLAPGGRVAVLESKPAGLHRVFGHATAPGTIRAELGAAGFTLVSDLDFLPSQSFLVFERRQGA